MWLKVIEKAKYRFDGVSIWYEPFTAAAFCLGFAEFVVSGSRQFTRSDNGKVWEDINVEFGPSPRRVGCGGNGSVFVIANAPTWARVFSLSIDEDHWQVSEFDPRIIIVDVLINDDGRTFVLSHDIEKPDTTSVYSYFNKDGSDQELLIEIEGYTPRRIFGFERNTVRLILEEASQKSERTVLLDVSLESAGSKKVLEIPFLVNDFGLTDSRIFFAGEFGHVLFTDVDDFENASSLRVEDTSFNSIVLRNEFGNGGLFLGDLGSIYDFQDGEFLKIETGTLSNFIGGWFYDESSGVVVSEHSIYEFGFD